MRQQAPHIMSTWSIHLPDIASLVFGHLMLFFTIAVVIEDGHYIKNMDNDNKNMLSLGCHDNEEGEEASLLLAGSSAATGGASCLELGGEAVKSDVP